VRVWVACPDQAAFDEFLAAMRRGGVAAPERFRPIVLDAPISPWSRDRCLVAQPDDPRAPGALLVPPRPADGPLARQNDWWIPWRLGQAGAGGCATREVRMRFDGGDFAVTEEAVFVDANLLAKNVGAGFRSRGEFLEYLEALAGRRVVALGEKVGDVPEHHIGMYLAPLGDGRVAVGDVRLAERLLRRAGRAQVLAEPGADLAPETVARFERPARLLEAAGFRVVRLPLLPLSEPRVFVTYTNFVMERRAGRGVVYLPSYGLPELDRAARETLEGEGFAVAPVDVAAVYHSRGTLGCLVNVLARR
jgi:N-dimethylarginine dimethylaminohydrolase